MHVDWSHVASGVVLDSAYGLGETSRPLVRIIAGTFRGRRLVAPRGRATRPTSDRVREAIFMSLEPLEGLDVVDLFAGSGALGIEALSRGARHVHFVESEPQALRALERNLEAIGAGTCTTTWRLDLRRGLKRLERPLADADLVLLDPPYRGTLALETLERLGTVHFSRAARIVVEHHSKNVLPMRVGGLCRTRERRYGETQVSTYRASSLDDTPERRHDVEDS